MFRTFLVQPLANGLIFFYQTLGGNLGVAIIVFTIVLRMLLNPLTKPYMESMKKMKDLAPQLEKLKNKYKNDKVKLAQAQADFYKQKGINPGGGCLPYLLQIVILIAFFNVFTQTLSPREITENSNPTTRFNQLLYQPLQFEEGEDLNTFFIYRDLTQADKFDVQGLPFPLPGPLLLMAAIVQFMSAKMMAPIAKIDKKVAEKTKESKDDIQVAMQQSMTYTFPLFTIFIGMSFPSALALYWLMFSLIQLLQQAQSQGWGEIRAWINRLPLLKSDLK